MSNPNREPHVDPQLEESLRAYANTPRPDARFVAKLERELFETPAGQPSTPFGWPMRLLDWWKRGTRPRQRAISLLGSVAAALLFVTAAALFVSWLGGIRQIAMAPTSAAAGPISPDRPATGTATPLATLEGALPITPTPPSASDFPRHQNAVLVAPADDLAVPQAEFTRLGIDIVPSLDMLREQMQAGPISAVYLHPDVFRAISGDALQQLYDEGIVIAMLGIPVSEIHGKLPLFSDYEELEPATWQQEETIVVAAAQRQDGPTTTGYWTYRDFFPADRFWIHIHNIERQLQAHETAHLTPTPVSGTAQAPAPTPDGSQTPVPTMPATPDVPIPTPTPYESGAETACSDVTRPALVLATGIDLDTLDLRVRNPLADDYCHLRLEGYAPGIVDNGALGYDGEALYYPRRDAERTAVTIWRQPLDGDATPLSFTTTPSVSAPWFSLLLLPESDRILWSTFHEPGESGARFRATLWLGDLASRDAQLLWQEDDPDTLPSTVELLHVSEDENLIYFARRAHGIGGPGPISARYGGLYTLSLDGGEPQSLFTCETAFASCLHDVDFRQRLLATITHDGERPQLDIVAFDGSLVARHSLSEGNYIGQPTFDDAGDVAFISADLQGVDGGPPVFESAAVQILPAPYTAEPTTLLQTSGPVFTLHGWYGADHVVTDEWNGPSYLALLSRDGAPYVIPSSAGARPILTVP